MNYMVIGQRLFDLNSRPLGVYSTQAEANHYCAYNASDFAGQKAPIVVETELPADSRFGMDNEDPE